MNKKHFKDYNSARQLETEKKPTKTYNNAPKKEIVHSDFGTTPEEKSTRVDFVIIDSYNQYFYPKPLVCGSVGQLIYAFKDNGYSQLPYVKEGHKIKEGNYLVVCKYRRYCDPSFKVKTVMFMVSSEDDKLGLIFDTLKKKQTETLQKVFGHRYDNDEKNKKVPEEKGNEENKEDNIRGERVPDEHPRVQDDERKKSYEFLKNNGVIRYGKNKKGSIKYHNLDNNKSKFLNGLRKFDFNELVEIANEYNTPDDKNSDVLFKLSFKSEGD